MERDTELGPGTMDAGDVGSLWGWFVAFGAILIILGLVAIVYPLAASVTMSKLLGVILIIGGIAQGISGIVSRRWKGFFLHLLAAALYIIIGSLFLSNPDVTLATLTLMLGIYLVVAGAIKVIGALLLMRESGWGWMLFAGVVDFILGALIWANWPSTASWVIGLLVGINIFLTGWSMLMIGVAAKMVSGGGGMKPKPA